MPQSSHASGFVFVRILPVARLLVQSRQSVTRSHHNLILVLRPPSPHSRGGSILLTHRPVFGGAGGDDGDMPSAKQKRSGERGSEGKQRRRQTRRRRSMMDDEDGGGDDHDDKNGGDTSRSGRTCRNRLPLGPRARNRHGCTPPPLWRVVAAQAESENAAGQATTRGWVGR